MTACISTFISFFISLLTLPTLIVYYLSPSSRSCTASWERILVLVREKIYMMFRSSRFLPFLLSSRVRTRGWKEARRERERENSSVSRSPSYVHFVFYLYIDENVSTSLSCRSCGRLISRESSSLLYIAFHNAPWRVLTRRLLNDVKWRASIALNYTHRRKRRAGRLRRNNWPAGRDWQTEVSGFICLPKNSARVLRSAW